MANVDLIVSVLEKEAGLCKGSLCDAMHGSRWKIGCFIGALLHHAGYSAARLRLVDSTLEVPKRVDSYEPNKNSREYHARKKLQEVYGLTNDQIDQGIAENDSEKFWYQGLSTQKETEERRKIHMIHWVKVNWK